MEKLIISGGNHLYGSVRISGAKNALLLAHADLAPCAFQSAMTAGCMENGLDCARGGAMVNNTPHYSAGMADIVDELAALKKLVFDDKVISMGELLDALDADRKFLTAGGVFTDDMIDGYIDLKMEGVTRLRMTTHPVEFDMYYSL